MVFLNGLTGWAFTRATVGALTRSPAGDRSAATTNHLHLCGEVRGTREILFGVNALMHSDGQPSGLISQYFGVCKGLGYYRLELILFDVICRIWI